MALALASGCGGDPGAPDAGPARWSVIASGLPEALMSVWGTSADDVWVVGGDVGAGPLVAHWDGGAWTRIATGTSGELWWVFGFPGGPVYVGGKDGVILRFAAGAMTPMTTPGNGTVYGLWGASPDEVWAVGGADGGASGGFAWRLDGDAWVEAAGFPPEVSADRAVWKVAGRSADDVWLVGTAGLAIHWDGAGFVRDDPGGGESLFTVAQLGERVAAVGGFRTGLVFEREGDGWRSVAAADVPAVVGVALRGDDGGIAVGREGAVLERGDDGWVEVDGPDTDETLHAVWVDPDGGAWTVGGQVQAAPLIRGVLAYRGEAPPAALAP